MFKRSASPGVSFQETYLIHPLLSTSNDTILVQDNIISCLHYLMAPLTLLSLLSTLQPEWTFKSINYIMSSLLIFSSASHHYKKILNENPYSLPWPTRPGMSWLLSVCWISSPSSLHLTHHVQPPWHNCSSNTPSLFPPQNLSFCCSPCLEGFPPKVPFIGFLASRSQFICQHFRGFPNYTILGASNIEVRVRVK